MLVGRRALVKDYVVHSSLMLLHMTKQSNCKLAFQFYVEPCYEMFRY